MARAELAGLATWHDLATRRRGRSAADTSGLTVEQCLEIVAGACEAGAVDDVRKLQGGGRGSEDPLCRGDHRQDPATRRPAPSTRCCGTNPRSAGSCGVSHARGLASDDAAMRFFAKRFARSAAVSMRRMLIARNRAFSAPTPHPARRVDVYTSIGPGHTGPNRFGGRHVRRARHPRSSPRRQRRPRARGAGCIRSARQRRQRDRRGGRRDSDPRGGVQRPGERGGRGAHDHPPRRDRRGGHHRRSRRLAARARPRCVHRSATRASSRSECGARWCRPRPMRASRRWNAGAR